jgi:predicted transcriptional regulator
VPTVEDEQITTRQRDVLRLHQEGKNPTAIGKELGISSQGVHGHLRRLSAKGLIEGEAASAKRVTRAAGAKTSGPPAPFDPADTIRTVVRTITAQLEQLNTREAEIDEEIERLRGEKKKIAKARNELDKLIPDASA